MSPGGGKESEFRKSGGGLSIHCRRFGRPFSDVETNLQSSWVHFMSPEVQEERFRKILERVESGSLSHIRDLARQFKLSPSHLQHLFKAQTGSGLGHRLTEQKLRRAAFLLLHTEMSIKEIGYAVGYKHPSSFVRAFERAFQNAPGDYRQKMLTERRFG